MSKAKDIFSELDERAVMVILSRAYHSCATSLERHVGIPAARWRMLFLVNLYGPCTQKALTQIIKVDPGSIARQLKSLERDGLVARKSDPSDNRLTQVVLTAAGLRVVKAAMKRRREFLIKMLHGLSRSQVLALFDMLERIERNISGSD